MKPDIKLVLGYPASGKTTEVREFVDKGYHRINRDELGGSLAEMLGYVERAIANGHTRIILDNTYPSVQSRASIIALGTRLGIPVTCLWMKTSFEDSQLNACLRMMNRVGQIPGPDDFKDIKDPNIFPVAVLFKYKKAFEKPTKSEGFAEVDIRNFIRIWDSDYTNSAWIFDADDTLRYSTGKEFWPLDPKDVTLLDGAKEKVKEGIAAGHLILGASNQSTCEKKEYMTPQPIVDECFNRTNELLGDNIEWSYCPHYRFPVACYCRKPQCGIGAYMIHTYKLDPKKCTYFGDKTEDKTWAIRCGFNFVKAIKKGTSVTFQ
jgi:histidinol phosphatase-like enzyme